MSKNLLLAASLTLSLVLLALAGCNQTKPEHAILLRLKGKKGDVYTYRVSMDMDVDAKDFPIPPEATPEERALLDGPQGLKLAATLVQEITDVSPEGDITWKETIKDPKVEGTGLFKSLGDQMEKNMKTEVATRVTNSRGDVLKKERPFGGLGGSSPLENPGFAPIFPEGSIRIGDTWVEKTMVGEDNATATYKAERLEQVAGVECVVISVVLTSDYELRSDDPIYIWVERENGQLMKAEGAFQGVQAAMKLNLKVNVYRLAPK
jgi:hypothetical protein